MTTRNDDELRRGPLPLRRRALAASIAGLLLLGGLAACQPTASQATTSSAATTIGTTAPVDTSATSTESSTTSESTTVSESTTTSEATTTASESTTSTEMEEGSMIELGDQRVQIEAEDGAVTGAKVEAYRLGAEERRYVGPFEHEGDQVEIRVHAETSGIWTLSLRYVLDEASGSKVNSILVNGQFYAAQTFEPGEGVMENTIGPVLLEAGENRIAFAKRADDWGWMWVDAFVLEPGDSAEAIHYDVTEALIDPEATPETRALYAYLRSLYGKKVLSGQQLYFDAEEEIARLAELTGSKPAIKGYDMINQTEGGPIDSQIERARAWVLEEGGILTLCWHWWAPSGGRAFYTKDTDFDIREAVKEGTDEHALILRDIDRIAELLLELQDDGIPVLWRPLHEASGGWFWWGAHGPEPYRALWKLLYERLVGEHGIHNLIWVANAQDPDWFVGNDYCDINGEDIYPGERVYGDHLPRFREAYETVGGEKIVALTENGPLPDIERMKLSGAMWAWFLPWWGDFTTTDQYTEDEVFTRVYAHPDVVNLEDLPADLYRPKTGSEPATDSEGDFAEMTVMELVAAMQPGWNVGNTLDAVKGETSWGNPPITRELFETIRAQGYRSVRIPVTWGHALSEGPEATIDPDYLARVQEVSQMALDEGFIVMLNMHHDSHWLYELPQRTEALMARFEAVWTQIAAAFRDAPAQLMLECINEPRFSEDWGDERAEYLELTQQLNRRAYEIIRASGGGNETRAIVMETLVGGITDTKIASLRALMEELDDERLIASAHFYGLWAFSMNIAGETRFTEQVARDIRQQMGRLHDGFIAHGIPVILGEYGLLGFDMDVEVINQGEKLKFFDTLVSTCRELDITTVLWDNGQHLDRKALEWRDPALNATIQQAVVGRSSATALDVVMLDENTRGDAEVELILNGNQLVGLRDSEGRDWVEGEDYALDGATLTLREAALEGLTGWARGRGYGLTLRFDAGPDWALTVAVIGEARLQSTEARSYEFLIPADFAADRSSGCARRAAQADRLAVLDALPEPAHGVRRRLRAQSHPHHGPGSDAPRGGQRRRDRGRDVERPAPGLQPEAGQADEGRDGRVMRVSRPALPCRSAPRTAAAC